MIDNIMRVKSRIDEIKTKVSQLDDVSGENFKKELQNTKNNGDNKVENKITEELAKIDQTLNNADTSELERLAPELLKKVTGVSSIESLKNRNSLDFYKTISEKLF
jgi:hypothetical protein